MVSGLCVAPTAAPISDQARRTSNARRSLLKKTIYLQDATVLLLEFEQDKELAAGVNLLQKMYPKLM